MLSHDQEKLLRREEAVQRQLNAAVERYAAALELFRTSGARRACRPPPSSSGCCAASRDFQRVLRSRDFATSSVRWCVNSFKEGP